MRIAILGAGGQLAHDLKTSLSGHDLYLLTREQLDIADVDHVNATLTKLRPKVVVNTAAYNRVDDAEEEAEAAFRVNALGPRVLALACDLIDATLVHFSTDYVFGLDALHRDPWRETDPTGPISAYGISKLAGEDAVRAHCDRHFILRTCGLYGIHGSRGKGGNFVETMLRLAGEGKPIRVVYDQRCTPSSTVDVAQATAMLLETTEYGLYHVTNSGNCSWFEFANEIFRYAGVTASCQPISAEDYGARARRPTYSVLACEKLAALGIQLSTWRDALQSYLSSRPAK